MEQALRLLQQPGGMKIAEIAAACGYSDQHYFSYCFKKYHGASPARMRRSEESV
jgi:two-component system response regulator YesN